MTHLPDLIRDLALILGTAAVVTLLFRRLKQPVVLGYLVAGMLVGPNIPLLPSVVDISGVRTWAEIGVVFLLFGLGLEFSFKRLARVGGTASLTAGFEIATMLGLGFMTGRLLGWTTMDSLFLGGILSISSTTIIIRAIDELGLRRRKFVGLVFGVLVVEDLVAILLLVLLSTVALSRQFHGAELAASVLQLGFFLILWFLGGIFLVPTLLKRARAYLNDETTLVFSLGLCLIMVLIAAEAGFSPALGAFIMGSIIGETRDAERVEKLIRPVRDLFAAVFFVSVGMLIAPRVLIDYAGPILLVTLVTVVGKFASTVVGAILAGQSLRHGIQAGFSLAQIGEFSFIIANLGLSLRVTSDFLHPIAVAVSALTTFTTPYLIRSADPFVSWLETRLPGGVSRLLEGLRGHSPRLMEREAWGEVMKVYAPRLIFNSVLVVAIFQGVAEELAPLLDDYLPWPLQAKTYLLTMIGLILTAPFLWALAVGGRPRDVWSAERLLDERLRRPVLVMQVIRPGLAILLLISFLARLESHLGWSAGLIGAAALLLLYFFSRRFQLVYSWFERSFLENLTERERFHGATGELPRLAPWDAHLARFEVPHGVPWLGRSLADLKVRERFGVTIVLIERGKTRITAPGRFEVLWPGDHLMVIGTDEEMVRFGEFLKEAPPLTEGREMSMNEFVLEGVRLGEGSKFLHRTIRDSGIREATNGLVVGIEREGKHLLNPDSSIVIQPSDVLWIVGDRRMIRDNL